MIRGLDYSAGRPRGSAIRAAGYDFVLRYLDNGLGEHVFLSAAEVADLRAAGVAIGLVFEKKLRPPAPDRSTLGRSAGIADAQAAIAQVNACGLAGWPIYMCIDFDIPDYAPNSSDPMAKLGPCGQYLAGAASVLGHARMGVYGGFYAVSRALDAGLATYGWQSIAWSGGQVDPRINVLQRNDLVVTIDGTECDVDEAHQSDFGQQDRPVAVGGNDMAVFLKNLDDPTQYATQDGPLVSGVREAVGQATLKAWPGASCEIGLSNQEFTDRVNKSKSIEGLAAAIAQLPALLAKAMPVSTGSLSADQLTAAVAAGVRQALDGMSQTTVLHDKAASS
ncbi:glycoside hydrolase domain-containing protein [Kutzneria sp. CA-103260]|uniref:glycoside hydrolase domain-containing protein n=1 Tax=Kutzneria sp. CA-103260 TaxID=2802641 RepID=UPI001BADD7AE|nr:glycoside hydrolase domain-containing protein [Kutzneria sp. CA-103260]QUQ66046.1 hypothetical protein JJ691_37710 [Kutzneria sp. CA-103260]